MFMLRLVGALAGLILSAPWLYQIMYITPGLVRNAATR